MRDVNLDRISERVYNASFVFTVILILAASIGTAIARYTVDPNIILVPDNVFKFIKDVIIYFVIPHTVKLLGDNFPLVVQAIVAMRQGRDGMESGYSGSTPLTNQPGGYGQTGFGQAGFDPNNIPNDAKRQE